MRPACDFDPTRKNALAPIGRRIDSGAGRRHLAGIFVRGPGLETNRVVRRRLSVHRPEPAAVRDP